MSPLCKVETALGPLFWAMEGVPDDGGGDDAQGVFAALEVVVAIEEGQMTVSRAAELLGLSRRQIFRLLDRFRSIGPNGLASRKRGVPSNNQIHRSVRQLAMMLVRQHYADFGPTLACSLR
ncbi:Winged helix-turn helix [Rhizobiales bacterium GAS113]|nr:Winged helix-turn helix [Rhizobiales bacterium GAS113]